MPVELEDRALPLRLRQGISLHVTEWRCKIGDSIRRSLLKMKLGRIVDWDWAISNLKFGQNWQCAFSSTSQERIHCVTIIVVCSWKWWCRAVISRAAPVMYRRCPTAYIHTPGRIRNVANETTRARSQDKIFLKSYATWKQCSAQANQIEGLHRQRHNCKLARIRGWC